MICTVAEHCGGRRVFHTDLCGLAGASCVTSLEITAVILSVQRILFSCVKWFYSWNGSSGVCVFPSVLALLSVTWSFDLKTLKMYFTV